MTLNNSDCFIHENNFKANNLYFCFKINLLFLKSMLKKEKANNFTVTIHKVKLSKWNLFSVRSESLLLQGLQMRPSNLFNR